MDCISCQSRMELWRFCWRGSVEVLDEKGYRCLFRVSPSSCAYGACLGLFPRRPCAYSALIIGFFSSSHDDVEKGLR